MATILSMWLKKVFQNDNKKTICTGWQNVLTYCPLHKMSDSLQTILLNIFSSIKIFVFWFKCHWNVILSIHWWEVSNGAGNGLVLNKRQAFTWTKTDPVHWLIYPSLGDNGLIKNKGMTFVAWIICWRSSHANNVSISKFEPTWENCSMLCIRVV